jgi:uncharacterized protein (TIGR03437 family)
VRGPDFRLDAEHRECVPGANGALVPNPIILGALSDENVLVLFGTGFRAVAQNTIQVKFNGVPGVVQFSGAQGSFLGLDEANVLIPQDVGLHWDVEVTFSAGGITANTVI